MSKVKAKKKRQTLAVYRHRQRILIGLLSTVFGLFLFLIALMILFIVVRGD